MTDKLATLARLPAELRELRQWCLAGADKAPLSRGPDGKLFYASVTEPSQWMTFDDAIATAIAEAGRVTTWQKKGHSYQQTGLDVGFVLHEADPFTCIDLDVKDPENAPEEPDKWTTAEQYDLFYRIMQGFGSYTEASRSGKGLHIWVRGKIGQGARRDGVEVYSQERFIICTGAVIQPGEIEYRQQLLDNMVSQMRPQQRADAALSEVEADEDDWSILLRAANASNADKFQRLWRGEWADMGFPSQSEADLALMSMFTFYTNSNEQCRRLFRESGLGKREKARKDDRYLNLTLRIIRGREERELAIQQQAEAQGAQLRAVTRAQALHAPTPPGATAPPPTPAPPPVGALMAAPVAQDIVEAGSQGLPWPPGFAGRIAQFIYHSAPRPVKEVAIVATLGLLAGICGKAWHIPGSGLNLYITLVARSGIGKEAMHTGLGALVRACTVRVPTFFQFVDFGDFASGPALVKACADNQSFVNVSGEWGRKLKRLAQDERDTGPLATLRTKMTDLYQKSGPQSVVGGLRYSNKEDNIASISGVAYSMIGETTPATFYESLTNSMMEDGFLSRFIVVEYNGPRVPSNKAPQLTPDAALEDALTKLAFRAIKLLNDGQSQPLGRTDVAAQMMQDFEDECDKRINGTEDESNRQMWNRAALKVLRVAGLLAVAENWIAPVIDVHHMNWALDLIRRDIAIMGNRIESGDVGNGDVSRDKKLVSVLRGYLQGGLPRGYKISTQMLENGIVPRAYLQKRTAGITSFNSHRMGHANALNQTIQTAMANGYLMEVEKKALAEQYNYHGKAYRILDLPSYD